jgi:hypothetical protein
MRKPYRLIPGIIAFALAGCTADIPFSWTEPESPTTSVPEFSADFDTNIYEYDGSLATDAANDIVGSDKAYYWEANKFTRKVNVTFNGSTATVETSVSGIETHIDGAYVTIDIASNSMKNVEITAQGITDNGALKIYGKNKFKLTLNGVQITSQRGPAINDQCKKRVFMHLADGTVNKLADQSDYVAEPYYAADASFDSEDAKGCLFSEGNVILSGTGALVINAHHRHGLATDGYLWMRPGATLAVTNAARNAIHAKGDADENLGIVINGGYIYANVSSDGGKCLKTDNNIIVNSGYLNLNTSGTTAFDADENDTSYSTCIKSDLNTAIRGGALVLKSIGDSSKGINANQSILISGGEIYSYSLGRNIGADVAIEQSAGKTYTFSQNGHAVYAPSISVSDGTMIAISANTSLQTPQQLASIDGGYIFAYGHCALTKPASVSKQAYVLIDGLSTESNKSTAVTSGSNSIIAFTADFTEPKELPMLFSTPDLTKNSRYTIYSGGTITDATENWHGLLLGGVCNDAKNSNSVTAY